MNLLDVNVLVYAHRPESPYYVQCRRWVYEATQMEEGIALADIVASGYLRIVTNPKIFRDPTPIDQAMHIIEQLRSHPTCRIINPSTEHFAIFAKLCRDVNAKGNDIPDTYIAAIALEHGCTLITADKGFARFPKLRWETPW